MIVDMYRASTAHYASSLVATSLVHIICSSLVCLFDVCFYCFVVAFDVCLNVCRRVTFQDEQMSKFSLITTI